MDKPIHGAFNFGMLNADGKDYTPPGIIVFDDNDDVGADGKRTVHGLTGGPGRVIKEKWGPDGQRILEDG